MAVVWLEQDSGQEGIILISTMIEVFFLHKHNSLFFKVSIQPSVYTANVGGAVASWLVRLSTDRVVQVQALAGDTVLCSWARHFTLMVPLSTQEYKWVLGICWEKLNKLLGSDLRWTSIPSRGSRNTPSRFMLRKLG